MGEEPWLPPLTLKQKEILYDRHRYLLVSGPRYSAKTWGVLNRLVMHAWETPGARVGVFVKTLKTGKNGVWDLLYEKIVQEWAANVAGFDITVEKKTDGATRMEYFKIRNYWGGESTFQLHSMNVDDDVGEKMKGTEFSCIYFAELTTFNSQDIFNLSIGSLRMSHLSYDQHLWISDTNPSDDEGASHWVYRLFYEERLTKSPGITEEDQDLDRVRAQMGVIECTVADNTFLDKRQFNDLKLAYRNNPDLYDCYINGKWVETSNDSLFNKVWSAQRHVIGNAPNRTREEDWEVPVPNEATTTLYTGWDIGDSNHAFQIAEKMLDTSGKSRFHFLDEITIIDEEVPVDEFALMCLERIEEWEEAMGKKYQWVHWSDESAFSRFRASANTWDHVIVQAATKNKIQLIPAPKFKFSVRMRCQMVRQMLSEGRLTASVRCPTLISALRGGVKKSKKPSEYIKPNKHKHPFDAATYMIMGECFHELADPSAYGGAPDETPNLPEETGASIR